ncbi:MAG: CBS domain-containing protein, partial [Verrucomicrobiota bacterium]|nr:CBS domain-containing protein [Verrucomicrobiota bacterium]
MNPDRLKKMLLPKGASIMAAIRAMDAIRCGIVLVVDEREKLLGVVTDGDVRRAILNGLELSTSLEEVMARDPILCRHRDGRAAAVELLKSERCRNYKSILLPFIDDEGR